MVAVAAVAPVTAVIPMASVALMTTVTPVLGVVLVIGRGTRVALIRVHRVMIDAPVSIVVVIVAIS